MRMEINNKRATLGFISVQAKAISKKDLTATYYTIASFKESVIQSVHYVSIELYNWTVNLLKCHAFYTH
jgi:hypothetical protein